MTNPDIRKAVLTLLFTKNQPMQPKDIESELWNDPKRPEFSRNAEAFHVHLHRTLEDLRKKEHLLHCDKISRKKTLYSIKNREEVQLILNLDRAGWRVLSSPKSLEMSTTLIENTYETAIQSLSKYLFAVLMRRTNITAEGKHKGPGLFIVDGSIPLVQTDDSNQDQRFFFALPDENSMMRMRNFTTDQTRDFMQYLTDAWSMYFREDLEITHGNIVIIHFEHQQSQKLKQLADQGKRDSIGDMVLVAVHKFLDQSTTKPPFLIEVNGPATQRAIQEGRFKDTREAAMKAIEKQERDLARHYLRED